MNDAAKLREAYRKAEVLKRILNNLNLTWFTYIDSDGRIISKEKI